MHLICPNIRLYLSLIPSLYYGSICQVFMERVSRCDHWTNLTQTHVAPFVVRVKIHKYIHIYIYVCMIFYHYSSVFVYLLCLLFCAFRLYHVPRSLYFYLSEVWMCFCLFLRLCPSFFHSLSFSFAIYVIIYVNM